MKKFYFTSVITIILSGNLMIGYIIKQGVKQVSILTKAKKIEKVKKLSNNEKIELLNRVIKFCDNEMGFRKTKSYRKIYLNGEKPVAYNVVICPELSLEPETWKFPVVGSFSYIGFFKEKDAEKFLKKYPDTEYDVYTRPVYAYSLLGYHAQVIFESQLKYDDFTFTNIIIHEKLHETIFVKDNLALSESLAVFIAEKVHLEFIAAEYGNDSERYFNAVDSYKKSKEIDKFYLQSYNKLKDIYETDKPDEMKREMKGGVMSEIARRHSSLLLELYGIKRQVKFNNAVISGWHTYDRYKPVLEKQFKQQGSDIKKFISFCKNEYRSR